jgi:hypothetical protein
MVLRFSEDHLELGEPPLRSLAKLILESAPLRVRRLDHPTPGSVELLDLASDICLQAGIRNRDPRRGSDRLDELVVGQHVGVVNKHGNGLTAVADDRDATIAFFVWQLELAPAVVDIGVTIPDSVPEDERAVTECVRKVLA